MYCGDETGAFVGDVGSHSARFGYGGEDCPKVVVPSAVFCSRSSDDGDDSSSAPHSSNRGAPSKRRKYSAPVSLMRVPPDDCFPTSGDGEGSAGFIPIYQSLNSNNQNANNADSGLIQDIDAWASVWEYSYEALCVRGRGKHMVGHKSPTLSSADEMGGGGPIDHPLLAADSTSRTIPIKEQERQRALMLETMFETLSAPAAYIASSPMLSSFAYGRQTSLVVDVGHSGARATPLVDGYCLSVGSVSSGRGGRWLGNIQQSVLEGVWNVNGTEANSWNGWGDGNDEAGLPPCRDEGIIPRYLLRPESEKYPGGKLELLKRSPFHSMAVHEVMYEMMTSPHVLPLKRREVDAQAPFYGYGGEGVKVEDDRMIMGEGKKVDDDDVVNEEQLRYVLPDGTRVNLARPRAGRDLRRLPELLLLETLPTFVQPPTHGRCKHSHNNMLPLQKLIHESLTQILDVDMRKELSANIILTGGASLFPALDKRLSMELAEVLPGSYKYKVIASKNSVENRYSAWIGGSILSSLGSFQQLWLSRKEYEECGAVLGLQRFKN